MLGAMGGTLRKWRVNGAISTIWKTTIKPAMFYGAAVTIGHLQQNTDYMDRAQKLAARLSLNDYTSSYDQLLQRLNWPSVTSACNQEQLRLAFDYHHFRRVPPVDWVEPVQGVRRSTRTGHGKEIRLKNITTWTTNRGSKSGLQLICDTWNKADRDIINIDNREKFLRQMKMLYK